MRLLPLCFVLLLVPVRGLAQSADPADQEAVAEALTAVVEAVRAGEAERAAAHVACIDEDRARDPEAIRPCVLTDEHDAARLGPVLNRIVQIFGEDASYVPDWQVVENEKGVEIHLVQVKVRDREPPSLHVFSFVPADAGFLLADVPGVDIRQTRDPETAAATRLGLLFNFCDRSSPSPTEVVPYFAHHGDDPARRRALDPADADERAEAMARLDALCERFDRSDGYRIVEYRGQEAPGARRHRMRTRFNADSTAAWLTFLDLPTGLALDTVEAADASSEVEVRERMEALLRLRGQDPATLAARFACPVEIEGRDAVRPCDYAVLEHRARVDDFLDALNELVQTAGPTGYGFTNYFTDREREGTWHVLEIDYFAEGTPDGEQGTLYAAFLEVDGELLLGDLDG